MEASSRPGLNKFQTNDGGIFTPTMAESKRIIAGSLIDGSGGPILHEVLLRIENGLIASVEPLRGDFPESKRAEATDLSHCTLLPGLADCHVHLAISGTANLEKPRNRFHPSRQQADALISEHLAGLLRAGILAVRDGGDPAGNALRFKRERRSDAPPVSIKAAGKGWHAPGRYGKIIGAAIPEDATLAERISEQADRPDVVKIVNSGLNSLTEFGKQTHPQFELHELQHAFEVARTLGLKTMVHANGVHPVGMSVLAGCDSIEHGFFMGRENLERMAENRTFWTPTACTMKAYCQVGRPGSVEIEMAKRNLDHQLEQIAYARRAGVRLVIGTDSGSPGVCHGTSFIEEFGLFMAAGLTLEEAVRAGSFDAAVLLGLEGELGRIEPGKPATFIAVRGGASDFPEALERLDRVYLRGEPVMAA